MNAPDDLAWLAYCYVSDELDSAQRAEFEQRLATDQEAREAVALAREVSDCLWATIPAVATAPQLHGVAVSNGWLPGVMGAAVATAACLLVLLVAGPWWRQADEGDAGRAVAGTSTAELEDLATIWSEICQAPNSLVMRADDAVGDELSGEDALFDPWEEGFGVESAWIQAAVWGLADDAAAGQEPFASET